MNYFRLLQRVAGRILTILINRNIHRKKGFVYQQIADFIVRQCPTGKKDELFP